jgi:hypothetical protein
VTTAMVPPAPASLPGPDGTTPATGRETPPMLLLGTLLVAGGAVATGLARRHPRRESHGP